MGVTAVTAPHGRLPYFEGQHSLDSGGSDEPKEKHSMLPELITMLVVLSFHPCLVEARGRERTQENDIMTVYRTLVLQIFQGIIVVQREGRVQLTEISPSFATSLDYRCLYC